jgi:effector-binding domain-containing protein
MTYTVEVKQADSQPLAIVRRRARQQELSTVVPDACGVVWNAIRALSLKGGRLVAIYWDDKINLDVGVEIDASFNGNRAVLRSATPAGRVLTTVHFGPYDRLANAHQAILEWAARHQHVLAGPNWEVYGHWNDDPAQLRTDVFYLLKGE